MVSLSSTWIFGLSFLAAGGAEVLVRYSLKDLLTRKQRQSIAGDKCKKTRCQTSAGSCGIRGFSPFCFADARDSLRFLAESSVDTGATSLASVASLSLRLAPA